MRPLGIKYQILLMTLTPVLLIDLRAQWADDQVRLNRIWVAVAGGLASVLAIAVLRSSAIGMRTIASNSIEEIAVGVCSAGVRLRPFVPDAIAVVINRTN